MAKSNATRAEARFRQLCCLGVGGEAVMPALIDELRILIPSVSSTFFFADQHGELANVYDDSPDSPTMIQVYLEEFHNRPDRLLPGFAFTESMRTQFGVLDCESAHRMDLPAFRRSEFYNVFYRKHGWDSFMRAIVREPGRALGLGRLTLHRAPGEGPFSAEEKWRVAALLPFLAQALAGPFEGETSLTTSDRVGMIIADADGRMIHSSEMGRRLLYFATRPRATPGVTFGRQSVLPMPLARLCKNLHRVFADDRAAAPPTCHVRNVWGGFTFRAHWLDGGDRASGLVCISVAHEEPVPVALVRRIKELPLSRRQAEVCFLLANGASYEQIADRLGISRHTAIAHGRWIYDKLDVHNRTELIGRLLSRAH
jgi:DNA-binding CsgD family transcriptional regulator